MSRSKSRENETRREDKFQTGRLRQKHYDCLHPTPSSLPPSWTSFVLPDEEVREHFLRFVSHEPARRKMSVSNIHADSFHGSGLRESSEFFLLLQSEEYLIFIFYFN